MIDGYACDSQALDDGVLEGSVRLFEHDLYAQVNVGTGASGCIQYTKLEVGILSVSTPSIQF